MALICFNCNSLTCPSHLLSFSLTTIQMCRLPGCSINKSVMLQPQGLCILFALSGLLCSCMSTRLTFSLCSGVCSYFILLERLSSAALYKIILLYTYYSLFSLNNTIFLRNTYCIACYIFICFCCPPLKMYENEGSYLLFYSMLFL